MEYIGRLERYGAIFFGIKTDLGLTLCVGKCYNKIVCRTAF